MRQDIITGRPQRSLLVRHGSRVATELLDRARRQAEQGPQDLDRYEIETGLPPLDTLVPRWPGVTLLLGSEHRVASVLASQFAFATARAGKQVLWLCAGGHDELALLLMMTRLAGLPHRRVFVERNLRAPEWRRFERAAEEVSRLPLRFCDAHGAEPVELEDVICRSSSETQSENRLVILDGLDGPAKHILRDLERLSGIIRVPFLVVLDEYLCEGTRAPSVVECGLRPGSMVLQLGRPWPSSALAEVNDGGRLLLRIQRVANVGTNRELQLEYDEANAVLLPAPRPQAQRMRR